MAFHLYAWARHGHALPEPAPGRYASDSLDDRLPNPETLRVEKWVNLFRSGDYIGRHLWLADHCNYIWGMPDGTPAIPLEDSKGVRREYCIGAGGHTRYFDGSSPAVAAEVDRLIAAALGSPKPLRSPIGQETPEPDEVRLIKQVVEVSGKLLDRNRQPVPRDQHPKTHRCLRARFEICKAILPELQMGIFRPEGGYDAYVRFSNGRQLNDARSELHGMAIKLLDVPGPKLLDGQDQATTQDFVLVDHPTFFIRNLTDYVPFSNPFAKASSRGSLVTRSSALLVLPLPRPTSAVGNPESGHGAPHF